MKITSKIATAFVAIALTSAAHAVSLQSIVGEISFVGGAKFNRKLETASAVLAWTGVTQSGKPGTTSPTTGDFVSVALNTPVNFTAPWFFADATPSLWSVGGFSFDIGSSLVSRTTTNGFTSLSVMGTGMIKKSGFADTPGTFAFSTSGTNTRAILSFSSNSAASGGNIAPPRPNQVPDGGATLALLGVSFLGLGGVSRFIRRK